MTSTPRASLDGLRPAVADRRREQADHPVLRVYLAGLPVHAGDLRHETLNMARCMVY